MLGKLILWFYAYVWAYVLVITASLVQKRRMSHNAGVIASGKVRVVKDPTFPPHEFFSPGREWRCRIRHAPVSFDDDAVIQVRSGSLKLADTDFESPLDLEMNTGKISLFWSASSFFEFVRARDMVDGLCYRPFYKKYPRGLVAAKDGIRKYPSSFAELHYYSQTVQYFIGIDGIQRYCKFRLLPFEDIPESGIIPLEELEDLWPEVPAPGETRPRNYLKKEYEERLGRGKVKYRLQIQIHTPGPDDTDELFNCNVEWDEKTHPFMDVATVEIDKFLSQETENKAIFSLRNTPPSLGLIPATSTDDYNSLNYLRAKSDIAKKARIWAYKVFNAWPKAVSPER